MVRRVLAGLAAVALIIYAASLGADALSAEGMFRVQAPVSIGAAAAGLLAAWYALAAGRSGQVRARKAARFGCLAAILTLLLTTALGLLNTMISSVGLFVATPLVFAAAAAVRALWRDDDAEPPVSNREHS